MLRGMLSGHTGKAYLTCTEYIDLHYAGKALLSSHNNRPSSFPTPSDPRLVNGFSQPCGVCRSDQTPVDTVLYVKVDLGPILPAS